MTVPRSACEYRQLAYVPSDENRRRQVFISSHHEDMSNHLLDLLVPPAGRTMLVIRFTGWSNESGPSIECFAVEASQRTNTACLCKALAEF